MVWCYGVYVERQMTAIDVAKEQRESDCECDECGRSLEAVGLKFCEGCCPHENVEDQGALLPDKCLDCSATVGDDE